MRIEKAFEPTWASMAKVKRSKSKATAKRSAAAAGNPFAVKKATKKVTKKSKKRDQCSVEVIDKVFSSLKEGCSVQSMIHKPPTIRDTPVVNRVATCSIKEITDKTAETTLGAHHERQN